MRSTLGSASDALRHQVRDALHQQDCDAVLQPGAFQGPPSAEEMLTEYERERSQRIMRNNRMLRCLGIPALASILNSSNAKSKDIEHGVADKAMQVSETSNTCQGVSSYPLEEQEA
ncbi:unnamed protein product [Urochloa humidicola]